MAATAKKRTKKASKPAASTWRDTALADVFEAGEDLPEEVLMTLTNFGVKSCGQLADRLIAGNAFGLKPAEVTRLQQAIEQISSDDDEPIRFAADESTDLAPTEPEPAEAVERHLVEIRCPACNGRAPLVDGGEFGCETPGCGWLGTEADAKAFTASVDTNVKAVIDSIRNRPFTPEELAQYDAETVTLVREAESRTADSERIYNASKAQAAEDKKEYESDVLALRRLIRDRAENRGNRPQQTLLDTLPRWRGLNVTRLALDFPGAKDAVEIATGAGINTLGDLWEQVGPDHEQGASALWSAEVIQQLRDAVQKEIDAEAGTTPKDAEPAESDLYKSYPLDRWQRFGLTPKDIEKLAAGETKGHATGFPIHTVGDLQRFITPNPNSPGYAQNLGDIKGIGAKGAERISEAEMGFWSYWRAGGEAEFAAEQNPVEAPAEQPVSGESEAA